ncbi:hypothetical protein R6G99_09760 [Actinotignum timonense]|nr:hypothetical protein [Actinotignum timonense]
MKKSLTAWAGTVLVACLAFAGCGSQKSNDSADSSASPASSSAAASSAADGTTTNEAVFPATIDTKFGPVTVKEAPQRVVALGWRRGRMWGRRWEFLRAWCRWWRVACGRCGNWNWATTPQTKLVYYQNGYRGRRW